MTTDVAKFVYDPFSVDVMADPMPYYRVLRDKYPVYYAEKYDLFAVSRFQDVWDVLSDPSDTFLSTEGSLPAPALLASHNSGPVPEPPANPLGMHTAHSSAVHGAIRQAHGRPLRPRAVAGLEDRIRGMVREELASVLPRGEFDIVADLAGLISAQVAGMLFRLPASAAPVIQEAVNSATKTDPRNGGVDMSRMKNTAVELVLPVIRQRRAAGADGSFPLVDGLLEFRLDGRELSDDEIALQYVGLLIGAAETLPKIFGHGLMELQSRPAQLAAVRSDIPGNARLAVEEMFRYCGPAQWFARTVRKPTEIAGTPVRPGQRIIALIQSANRDEREFDDPDEFRWNRDAKRTLAFGRGPHMCIGVHLARLEGRILLEEWLRAVPEYEIDADCAVRMPSSFQWGFSSVPVRVANWSLG